jgi:hypothetical protein
LKYEDLCSDPERTSASLFDFIGLPISGEELSSISFDLESRNHKSRSRLSPGQLATINRVQGDLLRELGYDL